MTKNTETIFLACSRRGHPDVPPLRLDDSPLTMATDLLVWNVTKESIRVRRAIVNEASWPAHPLTPPGQPDPKQRTPFSAFIAGDPIPRAVRRYFRANVDVLMAAWRHLNP